MTEQTPDQPYPEEPTEGTVVGQQNPMLSNAVYNKLKFVAQILLPALGALYFGLASIWGLPAAEEVVGSIVVIDTFLGVLLGVSSRSYKAETEGKVVGVLNLETDPEGQIAVGHLEYPGDPQEIVDKNLDKVTFKVRRSR